MRKRIHKILDINAGNKMINVTKTFLPDRYQYKAYIDRIFKSNWITNGGPLVRQLEKRLERFLGVKNIVLVANGTLALQVAYKALGLKGDVITTPFSFVATASSIAWEGLNPVFADIDRGTFCLDPKNIERSITPHTCALVPVHVFGNACEVEHIQRIARKHRLKIIYDASHAFGVKYKGKSLLNFGDISTLSFHATKIFHTCEGGALVINDDKVCKRVRKMIDFGIVGQTDIEELGINAKMNELEAAMGICVLSKINRIVQEQKKIHEYYLNNLSTRLTFQRRNRHSTGNYRYFPVIFESERQLRKVAANLNKEKIYPRRYFYPSLETLCYLKHRQEMHVSSDIARRILCLPVYPGLKRNTQDRIMNIVHASLG